MANTVKYYKITNLRYSTCLSVSGSNLSALTSHKNVVTNTYNNNREQWWRISSLGNNVQVKSAVNPLYGLNVYRTGSPYNCDVFPISGNETDAAVNIVYNSTYGAYMIKLTNYNLYLTASGSGENANVYWGSYTNDHSQYWTLTPLTLSNERYMYILTCNINQKYSSNDTVIKNYGCCVCCACDVASKYKGSSYTLSQMKSAGVYTTTDATCHWGNVPSAYFITITEDSQSEYYHRMKLELESDHLVIAHITNAAGTSHHYVVVYKYFNYGESTDGFIVGDPYNSDTTDPKGRYIRLKQAMEDQGATRICELIITGNK